MCGLFFPENDPKHTETHNNIIKYLSKCDVPKWQAVTTSLGRPSRFGNATSALSLSPRLVSKFIFSTKFMTNLQTETSPMMFELRHFCLQLDGALGLLDLFLCAFVQPKGDETRPNQGRMPDTIPYDMLIGKIGKTDKIVGKWWEEKISETKWKKNSEVEELTF